jgi:hypothetical protein
MTAGTRLPCPKDNPCRLDKCELCEEASVLAMRCASKVMWLKGNGGGF